MNFNRYLEDDILSTVSSNKKQSDKVSLGDKCGEELTNQDPSKKIHSTIENNIQANTIQVESEVEDNGTQNQENQNKKSNKDNIKSDTLKLIYKSYPKINKKYSKQYKIIDGYQSDSNFDQQREDRCLRLCQFLLIFDNKPTHQFFLNNDKSQCEEKQKTIPNQKTIAQEKRSSNSLQLDDSESNSSRTIDLFINSQGDQQNNEQSNILNEENQSINIRNELICGQRLKSFSMNQKKKQLVKKQSSIKRSKSFDFDREADQQNLLKKKFTLKQYINHFFEEKRQSLLPKKNTKKTTTRQQSWRDLDYSDPHEYKKQYITICKEKQQKSSTAHLNEAEQQKKFSALSVPSSVSITDENISCSENEICSNSASESGTPKNHKYSDNMILRQGYQKSKFHHQTKVSSNDQKTDKFTQDQNTQQKTLSLDLNNQLDKNAIQNSQKAKINRIKKEKHLKLQIFNQKSHLIYLQHLLNRLLERTKSALNQLVYIYNYYRSSDLLFIEEDQFQQNIMLNSFAQRTPRINQFLRFGDTEFSEQTIQDQINESKTYDQQVNDNQVMDSQTSSFQKRSSQNIFDDVLNYRKKSQSISFQGQSPKEFNSSEGLEINSQNQMLLSYGNSNSAKISSDKFLPLLTIKKQIQSLDLFSKFASNKTEEISLLKQIDSALQEKDICNLIKLKIYCLKSIIFSSSNEFIELRKYINLKYNYWKLKRWFASYKRKKTQQQKAQLLENMQNKKAICRICEKEILMTNMKKHSINCKQLQELNQSLKVSLKEMNSSLFFFFQQNRELQVQYTLVQKTLEKMMYSQQILIESRNKNNQQSEKQICINGQNSNNKSSSQNNQQENENNQQNNSSNQKRRFTCLSNNIQVNSFNIADIKKNNELLNPMLKFIKQNVDINKEIMTNSELLPAIHGSIIDSSVGIDRSGFVRNSAEVISQSDKPCKGISKQKLVKNNSIIIQQEGEDQQIDVFSNSLPNFNSHLGKSTSSINSRQNSRTQINEDKHDKPKQLDDIYEEESIASPYGNGSPLLHPENPHHEQNIDSIIKEAKNNKLERFLLDYNVKEVDESQEGDQDSDDGGKNFGRNKQSKILLDSSNLNENNNNQYDMKFKVSQSKQLNGVPLITLNDDLMYQFSMNSIQQCNSNTYSNSKKMKINFENSSGENSKGKDDQLVQIEKQNNNFTKEVNGITTLDALDKSQKNQASFLMNSDDLSFDIKKVLQKQMQNCLYQDSPNITIEDVSSPLNLAHSQNQNQQKKQQNNKNANYLTINYENDLFKKSQELLKSSNLSNQIIASSDIRNLYHQNNTHFDSSINSLNNSSPKKQNNNLNQYKVQVHMLDSSLQPIQEQGGENDVKAKENYLQQKIEITKDIKNSIFMDSQITPHQFSASSLSSSLSDIDNMVADFFKQIQIKNENEKHILQKSITNEGQNISDVHFQNNSQWAFSQEFSPKGGILLSNLNASNNKQKNQDSLNYIESQQSPSQRQRLQMHDNNDGRKNNNGFSDELKIQGNHNDIKHKIQNNTDQFISTKSIPNNGSQQELNSQNNITLKNNINLLDKLAMSNIIQTNSMNVIYTKLETSNYQVQNPASPQEEKQQNQQQTKKVVLQKLVSIDCYSAHSSNSNLSLTTTNKILESPNNSQINKSKQQHEQNQDVQKGTMNSIYSLHSRKSIQFNTIDIVTNELSDCFHTNQNSISNFYKDREDDESPKKASKFKDISGSSSPRSNQKNMFSKSPQRQDGQVKGSKLQKQKSIFSQKFSKQKSESLNVSDDDDMYKSEYIDQVPDLANKMLMKMKLSQKKHPFKQMEEENLYEEDIYEEQDFDYKTKNSTNQKYKKGNQGVQENNFVQKSQSKQISTNQEQTSIKDIFSQDQQILPASEVLDAKDLSYISKTSSSSQNSLSKSSISSESSCESSNEVSIDEKDKYDEQNQEQKKKIKNTERKKKSLKKKKQKKSKNQIEQKNTKSKNNDNFLPITPSPQKNPMRRQSLPLHLLIDFKHNGAKSSEIQKDIVTLSTNFEIKIKQHEKSQCQTKLRITDLVQNLGKVFIIQDYKSNAQCKQFIKLNNLLFENKYICSVINQVQFYILFEQKKNILLNIIYQILKEKMSTLSENEQRIDFLLKKITGGQFKTKVMEIIKLFNVRLEYVSLKESERQQLIQQVEQIEKIVKSTSYIKEKKKDGGDQSDQSIDSEPKSPVSQAHIIRKIARSGTYNGNQKNQSLNKEFNFELDQPPSIEKIIERQNKQRPSIFKTSDKSIENEINNKQQDELIDKTYKVKKTSEIIKRKKKSPQQLLLDQRRSSCLKMNFDNMLSKKIEKDEELKIEKLDEFLPKNNGYSSDGVLDNPYSSCGPKDKKKREQNSIGIKDFDFLKLISKGAFGRVWLVRKKNTEDIYAMKIVNFAEKMNKNHLDSLKKENDILSRVQGDYVVKAVYTFTHESYICFVMEYMIGGDLGNIIQTYGVLEETIARFYIAEIVLAIHNLHQIGIIHRDLKPDNLLLDSKGHLKLTDFGLSDMGLQRRNKSTNEKKKAKLKILNNLQKNKLAFNKQLEEIPAGQRKSIPLEILEMKRNIDSLNILKLNSKGQKPANRIIGTPDYIAPEILRGEGLMNPAIDWWSVGVMLFELLIGIPPFNDDTVEKVFDNIKNYRIAWDEIPIGDGEEEVSVKSVNLMKKLLHPDAKQRLGSQGILQIQQDPFFVGIDWNNLKKMTAPIIPEVKNIFDTSNFDKEKVYQDGEQIDPFFGLPKGIETVNEAKKMLDKTGFSVKRYDVLFEENQKHIEKEEIQMQKMVKELEQQEKELEQLENEFGGDESNDESTFGQDIDTLISRNRSSSAAPYSFQVMNKKTSLEMSPQFSDMLIQKLKQMEDHA